MLKKQKAASKDAAGRAFNDGPLIAFPTPELPGSGSKGRPEKDSQPEGSPSLCYVIESKIQHHQGKVNGFLALPLRERVYKGISMRTSVSSPVCRTFSRLQACLQ